MTIKELTQEVENITGLKVIWELEKIYTAFNENYEVVAKYNPRTQKLEIIK